MPCGLKSLCLLLFGLKSLFLSAFGLNSPLAPFDLKSLCPVPIVPKCQATGFGTLKCQVARKNKMMRSDFRFHDANLRFGREILGAFTQQR